MDDPGRLEDGGGSVRDLTSPNDDSPALEQFTNGTLTGVLTYDEAFHRGSLFDALEARHTVVASWPAHDLVIYATAADGARYLPGDDVPQAAMPLTLTVRLDDPDMQGVRVEVIDPFEVELPNNTPLSPADPTLSIPTGEARYIRIRAFQGDVE